jgi:hypothetical protein
VADRQPLFALTLHRPWPWAVLHGKDVENRPWQPPPEVVGRLIALHAGKRWDYDGVRVIHKLLPDCPGSSDDHPTGIVGLARVTGCVTDSTSLWFFGLYGWTLGDVIALPRPVACRGDKGIWPVTGQVLDRVREGYRQVLQTGGAR